MPNGNGYLGLLEKYGAGTKPKEKPYDPEKEGWFAEVPSGQHKKAIPIWEEGEDWIIDFALNYGRAPTVDEYNDWKINVDTTGFTYTPESTMGKLGYAGLTFEDYYSIGQPTYGPGWGELTPEGSLVLTDSGGNPSFRTTEPWKFPEYLSTGRYLQPPGGIDAGIIAGLENQGIQLLGGYTPADIKKYYPDIEKPGQPLWNPPSMEDYMASGGEMNPERYSAQLQDYLKQSLNKDYQAVKDINSRIESLADQYQSNLNNLDMKLRSGDIDEKTYDSLLNNLQEVSEGMYLELTAPLENLMTSDKVQAILDEAGEMLSLGITEGLPLVEESQGMLTGPNLMALYDQYVSGQKNVWAEDYAEWEGNKNKGYGDIVTPSTAPTGNEMGEYFEYIRSMSLSGTIENFMMNNFSFYYNLWRQESKGMSFIEWTNNYLAI